MSQEDTQVHVHPDALELAGLLRPTWPSISGQLRLSGVPLNEGDDEAGEDENEGADDKDAANNDDDKQETFPREVVEELRRENAAARTARRALEEKLKEYEDRDKSDQEKAVEALQAAEKRAGEAEARLLRADVAADKGVPAKLAKFLTGSTKAELEKAADELLAELKGGNGRSSFDGGPREGQGPPTDMDSAIRGAAGRT